MPLDGHPELGPVIIEHDRLQARIQELGARIGDDYRDRPPLLVGVLKGAFLFLGDLARAIDLPLSIDFMAVSSYGSETTSSGVVRILKDLDQDLTGKHVIIVEDIIDTGLTLGYLRRNLMSRNPASLEVCALLVRAGVDTAAQGIRYCGFQIGSEYVIGYGLDAAERWRNLRDIRVFGGQSGS